MAIAMILVWYLKREMSSFGRYVGHSGTVIYFYFPFGGSINSLVTRLIQYTIATGLVTRHLVCSFFPSYLTPWI
jgi:hypothetical protein